MEIKSVEIRVPEGCNVILGHSHFIKTVEDLYETLAESGTTIQFGLAFCEGSGERLVRSDGNEEKLMELAEEEAMKIGAGHTFIIYLKGAYPVSVLNRIKNVSEVCGVYAATANTLEVVYVDTVSGRAVLGVSDGMKPLGIEKKEHKERRREFLRNTGYKR